MDWIAVYAAVVSTVIGGWTVYSIWRDRASVKIDAQIGYITSPAERLGPLVIVSAVNRGRRPVVLNVGGLLLKDGQRLIFGGDPGTLPKRLSEGESFQTWTFLNECRTELKALQTEPPIWAYWDTQGKQRYKSKLRKQLCKELLGLSDSLAKGIAGHNVK